MNVVMDIGNTFAKLGVFDREQLLEKKVLSDWRSKDIFDFLTNHNAENLIISNVARSLQNEFTTHLQKKYHCVLLSEQTPLPIQNLYETPKTLGKDRLAAVVGAFSLFPGADVLTIDAGTCITYDFLSSEGAYLGGNISPGMKMRLEAMHTFTKRLPLLDVEIVEATIGKSTASAMQLGVQDGIKFEMEVYIRRFCEEYQQPNVILTGGDAIFFAKKLKNEIFVNQNLVLIGLNKILNHNVSLLN